MSIREKISDAGRQRKVIFIEGCKLNGEHTERKCEPYSIKQRNSGEQFHFFCLLRNEWRSLRLENIYTVEILDETFDPRVEVEF